MNKKLLVVIIMIDVSSHMAKNEKMLEANRCYLRIVTNLQQLQKEHTELEIKIATMLVGSSINWCMEPIDIDLCVIKHFESKNEIADFKMAFSELRDKLSRTQFMAHTGKIAAPYIVLITGDIAFTQSKDEIEMLLANGWFINASRAVVLIDECLTDFDKASCKLFTGDVENIFQNESEIRNFQSVTLGPYSRPKNEISLLMDSVDGQSSGFSFDNPFSDEYDENPWLDMLDKEEDTWL